MDTPAPDVQRLEKGALPVHDAIARELYSRGEFTCETTGFTYEGRRDGKSVAVTSRHRPSGATHATAVYADERNMGGYRRHGITRVLWPDGKLQAIEYHCWGFPVGFHRYYDAAGHLRTVADYSKSDYQLRRNRPIKHQFFRGGSRLGNPQGEQSALFLEIYSVSGTTTKRERLLSSTIIHPWTERDPASTIEQWTREGKQGTVALPFTRDGKRDLSQRWELHNEPMDYVAFAETYQRDRKKIPGASAPERLNSDLLECPWIDEAMGFAYEDKRFAMAPVRAVSAQERDASPRAVYERCLQKPTVDCLLALGVEQAKVDSSHGEVFLRGAAVAAIHAKHPRRAIEAMDVALSRTQNFRLPNPLFAAAAALKADAEALAGDAAAAARSLDEAYTHATTKLAGYEGRNASALMLTAPIFARRGRLEQTRLAYDMAVAERAPRAYEILGDLGLAHARAGQAGAALAVAEQLRGTPPAAKPAPENRPGGEKLAEAVRALTGNPFAGTSRSQSHMLALAGAAFGAAERGRADAAREMLGEIETGLKSEPASSTVDMIRSEAASAYARSGDAQRAHALLNAIAQPRAEQWTDSAVSLCAANRTTDARPFLERAQALMKPDQAADLAAVAWAHARCGAQDRARELFAQARKTADTVPMCRGDMCSPGFRTQAQETVGRRLIDAGLTDLAEGWAGLGRSNEIRLAVHRARTGDAAAALKQLDRIAEADKAPLPLPLRSEVARARGEILAVAKQPAEAAKAFDAALRDASAIENTNERGVALITLAQSQAKAFSCESARGPLREARVSLDRTLLSGAPPIYHSNARAIAAILAQALAACDFVSEARETARSLLADPAASKARNQDAVLLADGIVAEAAAAAAEKGALREALKMLDPLQPTAAKLHGALRVEAIARKRSAGAELQAARALLRDAAARAGTYFLAARNDFERRQLVGHFAETLRRRDVLGAPDAAVLFPLLIEEGGRIASPSSGARSLCELGYTAQMNGWPDAAALFDQAIARAREFRIRTFPLDVGPHGACAYWLKLAGQEARARSVADQPMESLRHMLAVDPGRRADPGSLLAAAISYAEAEAGEIWVNWPRLVRD